ncbi:Z1 domain-containing protein [Lentzea sp. CC55]|uniref:Z1 domain-containing protein n=1 Tax=Lentzea sp. CC55 TaxID=2884909 RepID=UPI0027DEEF60|nr:Z1 domain-containing protein [Lentzea sp. CC55]MCG8926141.1 Z1 domain-containing protein [Lentzea sp. CC55]
MSSKLDQVYDVFLDLLESGTPDEAIKKMEILSVGQELLQQVRDRHERETIKIKEREEPRSVVLGNRFTWYTGPRPKDKSWPAIKGLLEKDGWSDSSIENLDAASTKVVSMLSHPKEKAFSTRGLVVGYVQSGKTTNFTAVMAKAADRGYKLFIVLAGIHNGLRRQTQLRLEQQLVRPNPSGWMQLTDPDKDFYPPANAAAYFATANKQHVLCVIKKNRTVLEKFDQWLASAKDHLRDSPALIIDDEADQATVATGTINPLICRILKRLPKSAYVGYTATPFANLLIDPSVPEDLYPKDFIVNLPQPEGHFGTEVLFGRDALDGEDPEDVFDGHDMIRDVPDDEVHLVRPVSKTEVDGFTPTISGTLRQAILYFWLTTAARRVRGTGKAHCTMLIHTSVNTSVHNSFGPPLQWLREKCLRAVEAGDRDLLDEFREIWEKETGKVDARQFGERALEFSELEPMLAEAIRSCRIVMDNSSSKDRLDYESGPVTAIAVGGNTLSRGLTLEGLAVSYFVRAVSAYDTLLQMGRWFGYRNGYADLPRIWMTDELRDWFRHLATVENEMRRDIDVYMVEDKTPLQFAVRLRTHPKLRVTAAAKMKDAVKAEFAYGGQRIQTRYFKTDPKWLLNNQQAARRLIADSIADGAPRDPSVPDGRFLFRDVSHERVLEFLANYEFHKRSQECDAELITAYIEKRVAAASALRRWNVAIVGNPLDRPHTRPFEFAPGVRVGQNTRARLPGSITDGTVDIKTLMSRRDAAIDLRTTVSKSDLSEGEIEELRHAQLPSTGLLVLYAIDKDSTPHKTNRAPLGLEEDAVGVGLVFPKPRGQDNAIKWTYVSADLSKVDIEEEDLTGLDEEER